MTDFSAKIKAILDLKEFSSQIAALENNEYSIRNFKLDTSGLPNQIQGSLDKHKFTITLGAIKMKDIESGVRSAGKKTGKDFAESMRQSLNDRTLEADIAQIIGKFEKLGGAGHKHLAEIGQDIATINALFAKIRGSADNIDAVAGECEQLAHTLVKVKNGLTIISAQSQSAVSSLKVSNLDSSMTNWLNTNTRAAQRFGTQVKDLQNKLNRLDASGDLTVATLKDIEDGFKQIQNEAKAAGLAGDTFGTKLSKTLGNVIRYFGTSQIFNRVQQTLVGMTKNVLDVDTAMTGLYRVTDLTESQYQKMYSNMTKAAKQYGAELTSVIDATAEWSKLGFDPNSSQGLANVTSMYQHVTDLPVETAVENLVTAYKGFEDQLLELTSGDSVKAVEYVADVYNAIGNAYAIDPAQLGDALTNSASALEVAGNTMQEAAAMATGITEVTQDAARAGTALKTVSMRLRGTTAKELEAMGEDTEGLIEVTSKLRDKIMELTGVDITEMNGDLKSTYDIMDGLAEVWNDLGTNEQSNLLETIAGKNRSSDIAALLNNWSQAEAALQTAMEASGSVAEEQAVYMEHLQGSIDRAKASWQELSNTILGSDFLKGLVDAGNGFLNILNFIIEKIGTIPTLIGAATAGLSLGKNVGELINQFQFGIMLPIEYAHEAFTNGDMNEIVRRLGCTIKRG